MGLTENIFKIDCVLQGFWETQQPLLSLISRLCQWLTSQEVDIRWCFPGIQSKRLGSLKTTLNWMILQFKCSKPIGIFFSNHYQQVAGGLPFTNPSWVPARLAPNRPQAQGCGNTSELKRVLLCLLMGAVFMYRVHVWIFQSCFLIRLTETREIHVLFQARDKNVTSVGLLATLDPSVNTSDQWCNEHSVSGIRGRGEFK